MSEVFLIVNSPQNTIRLENTEKTWSVGRGRQNDVVIEDQYVSRVHFQLTPIRDQSGYFITDMGTRNGTFLNGKKISKPTILKNGDEIRVGSAVIEFRCTDVAYETSTEQTSIFNEKALITTLVVDIRDYSVLGSQLGESRIGEILSLWTRQCSAILSQTQSWNHKYIGDAVMAIWRHNSYPDAEEIIQMLRVVDLIADYTASLHRVFSLNKPLAVGAGINTGHGMVGTTGSREAPDFSAVGPAVDLAFRLEAKTRNLESVDLLIGADTFMSDPPIQGFKSYSVAVKGQSGQVSTYGISFQELSCSLTQ
jgi:adenylate cyclase